MPKRLFILASFVIMTVALFLFGPSNLLGLPNSNAIFLTGYALLGVAQGFLFLPIIPEVLDSIYIKRGIQEGSNEYIDGKISDKAAGLFGCSVSIGLILAPILGSFI